MHADSAEAARGTAEPDGARDPSLGARFARVVRRHGDQSALAADGIALSYRALDALTNRLARSTCDAGGAPGDRIAVLMPHGGLAVAVALAVLKAGRVLVALDPASPPARLRLALDDADPGAVIVATPDAAWARDVAGPSRRVIAADAGADAGAAVAPPVAITPSDIAVLTYTSGSTGQPRAVIQTHARLLDSTRRVAAALDLRPGDRLPLFTALTGGNGLGVALTALLHGASLRPFAAMTRGVVGLGDWLIANEISVFTASASYFRSFVKTLDDDARFPAIRLVRLSSEPATAADYRAFLRHFPSAAAFTHTLASSETGSIAMLRIGRDGFFADGHLPIGRPIEGIDLQLLDAAGQPVPDGAVGEIVVRGKGFASGYWRNPKLSAARFGGSAEPDGTRTVFTGDLARRLPDGTLEFAGRRDARIKIRGHRVEPGEVEEALLAMAGVAAAVVMSTARATLEPRLVAFLVCEAAAPPPRAIRDALRRILPEHMVPTAFIALPEIPLNIHGKPDRSVLSALAQAETAPAGGEAPRGPTEQRLAAIWCDALALQAIDRNADFFECGGDSLAAAVVAAHVHAAFGVAVNLGSFVAFPELSRFAHHVGALQAGAAETPVPLAAGPRGRIAPLSLFQQRIWDYSRTPMESASYTVATADELAGELDVGLLSGCIDTLSARHDALRTTIAEVDGVPMQRASPPVPVPLPVYDVSLAASPDDAARSIYRDVAAQPFDLARGPLVRFALIRLAAQRHWLVRVNHHIVSDGWSGSIIRRELAELYEARKAGTPEPGSEPALQYADFAAWQRTVFAPGSPAYSTRLAWWRERITPPPPAIELPLLRGSPVATARPEDGHVAIPIPPGVAAQVGRLKRREGTTDFAVWLAGFAAAAAAAAGSRDFVIGTYVANRGHAGLQDVIGCLINLVVLRFDCDPALPFATWLARTRRSLAEAEAHGDVPYEQLMAALRAEGAAVPAVSIIVNHSAWPDQLRFAGITLTRMARGDPAMPWGFSVSVETRQDRQRLRISFDARRYDSRRVTRFGERLVEFVAGAAEDPQRPLGDLAPGRG